MISKPIGSLTEEWAGKTSKEIIDIAEQDGSVLILPIASLEQHGPHMPVATDTILATAISHNGAEHTDEEVPAVVLPPVWAGFSPHHMALGGTVTLQFSTMFELVHDIADSALENGFDALLVVNGHGGNGPLLSSVVNTLGPKHPEVDVLGLSYWLLAEAAFNDTIRDSDIGGASHAGEFETSLMMHLRPELVREDDIPDAEYYDSPYDLGNQDLMVRGCLSNYKPFTYYSQSGATGDPTLSTAEKGEQLYAVLGEELGGLITEIYEENR